MSRLTPAVSGEIFCWKYWLPRSKIFYPTLEWGQQTCTLTKHTRRWTYSALRHFSVRFLCSKAGHASFVSRIMSMFWVLNFFLYRGQHTRDWTFYSNLFNFCDFPFLYSITFKATLFFVWKIYSTSRNRRAKRFDKCWKWCYTVDETQQTRISDTTNQLL